MDEMLDQRRAIFNIAKQLFDRCADVDRFTKQVDVKNATACPTEMDEKKNLAAELERALSWLIGQIGILINELFCAQRRLQEAEGRLKNAEQRAKDVDDQLKKCDDAIRDQKQKLDDANDKLKQEK